MANIPKKTLQALQTTPGFIHIPDICHLSEKQLNIYGFYRGFPCAHDHVIREKTNHWCYQCAEKIRDNICGFDVNYMNGNYKHKYVELWRQVAVGPLEDCWESPSLVKKRICMPSYRSQYSKQLSSNVNAHKAIYQSAWGDIGNMFVTRVCGNNKCLNPLHLISSWNRLFPPSTISPFDHEFKPEKLMQFARIKEETQLKHLREYKYKRTIQHPLVNRNCPDYDEEYRQYYKIECQDKY